MRNGGNLEGGLEKLRKANGWIEEMSVIEVHKKTNKQAWSFQPLSTDRACWLSLRYIQSLTFDIILSTAFGIQSECQTNPADPVMAQVRDALRFRPLSMAIIGFCLLLPYGKQMLTILSPWLFQNLQGILNVADQVISVSKEQEELTGKVHLSFCRSLQVFTIWRSLVLVRAIAQRRHVLLLLLFSGIKWISGGDEGKESTYELMYPYLTAIYLCNLNGFASALSICSLVR